VSNSGSESESSELSESESESESLCRCTGSLAMALASASLGIFSKSVLPFCEMSLTQPSVLPTVPSVLTLATCGCQSEAFLSWVCQLGGEFLSVGRT
jgi:hypothetical protein